MSVAKYKDPTTGEWTPIGLSVGGMEMELLWENASPRSEFAAQTIAVDLSKYDRYVVDSRMSTGSMLTLSHSVCCGDDLLICGNDKTNIMRRLCTYSNSGLSFGDSAVAGNDSNGSLIPIRIYGIKGVKEND